MMIPDKKHNLKILLLLIFLTVIFRTVTLDFFSTNNDPSDYWRIAKTITLSNDYSINDHRSARFGIILPVAFIQKLLGTQPVVYYVTPLLMNILEVVFLYLIVVTFINYRIAFLSCIALIIFPYCYFHGYAYDTNIYPHTFTMVFVLISFYLLFRYKYNDENKISLIIASSVLMFMAYETKITALFFLPAVMIMMRAYKKELIIYLAILLTLFMAETLLYYLFTDFTFGQMSIITKTHLAQKKHVPIGPIYNLFQRFSTAKELYQVVFLLFSLSTVYLIITKRKGVICDFILISFSFIICSTFAVKSINPVIPTERFNDRIWQVILPYMLTIIISAAYYYLHRKERVGNKISPPGDYTSFNKTIAVISLTFIFSLAIYAAIMNKDLKLLVMFKNSSILNNAYDEGVPIVVKHHPNPKKDSMKGLNVIKYIYLQNRSAMMAPVMTNDNSDALAGCIKKFYYIGAEGITEKLDGRKNPGQRVIEYNFNNKTISEKTLQEFLCSNKS